MKLRYFLLSLASLLALPLTVHAADQGTVLTFTPPATDVSVILLGNLFGIVDGVLHGTGGQMLGNMFKIFNSAVLALGGIVVMYTTMMGVANTANEGEFLGRKWSSIWIPIRSVLGVGLLIPKASGYCMMQIFVMWLVVQGVGAADKTWDATLNYLKRGGSIIQRSLDTATGASEDTASDSTSSNFPREYMAKVQASSTLLMSQVCMRGLQNLLEKNRRENHNKNLYSKKHPDPGPVPSFADSVGIMGAYDRSLAQKLTANKSTPPISFTIHFPNFTTGNYKQYNGICGSMTIKNFDSSAVATIETILGDSDTSEKKGLIAQAEKARALGAQQMFIDMGYAGQLMVTNTLDRSADQQLSYGKLDPQDPQRWVSLDDKPPLMQGTELKNAARDYFAIMRPTLNLLMNVLNADEGADQRFYFNARRNGWIFAGSYFFDLVRLNAAASSIASEPTDTVLAFLPSGDFVSNPVLLRAVKALALKKSDLATLKDLAFGPKIMTNDDSYINEAKSLIIRTEANISKQVAPTVKIDLKGQGYLTRSNCEPRGFMGLQKAMCNLFYNGIYVSAMNKAIGVTTPLLNKTLDAFIGPTLDVTNKFNTMLAKSQDYKFTAIAGGNPIIALGILGNNYLTAAFYITVTAPILMVLISFTSLGMINPFLMLLAPIGIMILTTLFVSGAVLAFYIPLIPYLIFFFGSLAWFIAVIEAMVAAPLVALGIMQPEGEHELLGRANSALMILLNVFLRPVMMIIGFIAAFILSYVVIWLLNATFGYVFAGLESSAAVTSVGTGGGTGMQIFGGLAKTVIYIVVAMMALQKCFSLIHLIPDKVLRFIGGYGETLGAETAGMAQEVKGYISGGAQQAAGEATKAGAQVAASKPGSGEEEKTETGGEEDKGGDEEAVQAAAGV